MGAVNWNQSMHIGVKEIDAQHEKLTGLINTLYYAYMDGSEQDILAPIIHEINDYAHYHFNTEEKYMDMVEDDYPQCDGHVQEHMKFFSSVLDFLFKYLENKQDIAPELLDFLTDWWTSHIMHVDRQLGKKLQEKGVV